MLHSKLESLAPELLLIIVQQVTRPTDLRNLCLTCRTIGTIATQRLYETIVVDPEEIASGHPHGILTSANPGISAVRSLAFLDLEDEEVVENSELCDFIFFTITAVGKDRLRTL